MLSADDCDVFVIGAGPAGATAAQLLASWGWSVVVAHRTTGSPPSLAESLPPSTRKLLEFLRQLDSVDSAGFHPNTGNIAQWAGESRATQTPDAGFHVSRAAFDRVLRSCARSAGARIIDAGVLGLETGNRLRVKYAAAGERPSFCDARYVLDCSGRAGVVARHGFRRSDAGYRTLAIAAEWSCDSWPADERTRTIVESYRDGWAWSVPLSKTTRQSTVMIDPARCQAGGAAARQVRSRPSPSRIERPALRAIYHAELKKAASLSERLTGAQQTSAPWACDASLYHAPRAADAGLLLVGDAASFIEPLSSAGVKKALASAWRAAVVTNTCLGRPEMAGAAEDLYVRRERHVYTECLRRSSTFFAEAAAVYDDPFWSSRADAGGSPENTIATGPISPINPISSDPTDAELARDAGVREAFNRLRVTPRLRFRAAGSLRFASTAAIEGREVVMRDALVVPGADTPLRFAAGVNLPVLARLATQCDEVPSLVAAYHAQVGPVPLGGLLTGLSLLVARHALIAEDSTS